ncbi:MAG: hypothetical protein ACK2T0_05500 [Anaerolineales bacterium]
MRPIAHWLVAAAALVLSACSAGSEMLASGARCKTTAAPAPAFVPPAPYPPQPPSQYANQFWYGTADLWTMLPTDGTWRNLPQTEDGSLQKVFWWSAEHRPADEPVPALAVSGRRLDGASDPLISSAATNASADFGTAMLAGITVPAPGCWEITGHYRGHELSFVVQVAP